MGGCGFVTLSLTYNYYNMALLDSWLSRRKRDSEEAWLIACSITRSLLKSTAAIVSATISKGLAEILG